MSPLEDLDAGRIAERLGTRRYGRSLQVLEQAGSTNDVARDAACAGAPSGHTVVADRQEAGRGSRGRSWASPGGLDLYVSVVDRPGLGLGELPPLTLAVGLGVAHAVDALLAAPAPLAQVKWPNDVWLHGKKCAGVLVEASSTGDALQSLVIGIGLNVNRLAFEAELAHSATSLRAHRPGHAPLDRAAVLASLLDHVEAWVDRLVADGAAGTAASLEPRLALRGELVCCGPLRGRLLGVSASGALRIETPAGPREAYSGRLEPASGA